MTKGSLGQLLGANPLWHLVHPMPPHATTEQRIGWYRAHEQHCGCRAMPARLVELERRARTRRALATVRRR